MTKRTRISIRQFMEDLAPTNNVGGGHVAGLGVGPQGDPPGPQALLFKKRRSKRMFSRIKKEK